MTWPAVSVLGLVSVLLQGAHAAPPHLDVSEEQLKCLSSRLLLHEASGKCYTPLARGPCPADSRLTLDYKAFPKISSVCSPCRCCHVARGVWWPGDRACHGPQDRDELCGVDKTGTTYLGENLFGEGACLCRPEHMRATPDRSGPCHHLYRRGPCAEGHVFQLVDQDQVPSCIADPCRHLNNISGGSRPPAAMAPDGQCYQLGSRGPCPEGHSFNVHPLSQSTACIDRANAGKDWCHVVGMDKKCEKGVLRGDNASIGLRNLLNGIW